MKIAFLLGDFPGKSTFIMNQITGLIDAGHYVTVYANRRSEMETQSSILSEYEIVDRTIYTGSPSTYFEVIEIITQIITNHPIASRHVISSLLRGKAGGDRLANIQKLLDFTDFSDFDVVHAHFGTTAKSFDFILEDNSFAVGNDIPFIISFYGFDISRYVLSHPDAYKQLFPATAAVTALSEDMAGKIIKSGCNRDKVRLQQLAVDTNKYEPRKTVINDAGPVNILTVARLVEKKGIELAIDAFSQLHKRYKLKYRIAGDGHLRQRIEKKIRALNLGDEVEMLGWINQSEIQNEFDRADLFLLPSVTSNSGDQEGTPTALLEAQACGVPVVSTLHAGIPEIVLDGVTGFLVEEGSVNSLVLGLEKLLGMPDRWEEMGKEGRKHVLEVHSIPVMTRRLEKLYNSVTKIDD